MIIRRTDASMDYRLLAEQDEAVELEPAVADFGDAFSDASRFT